MKKYLAILLNSTVSALSIGFGVFLNNKILIFLFLVSLVTLIYFVRREDEEDDF